VKRKHDGLTVEDEEEIVESAVELKELEGGDAQREKMMAMVIGSRPRDEMEEQEKEQKKEQEKEQGKGEKEQGKAEKEQEMGGKKDPEKGQDEEEEGEQAYKPDTTQPRPWMQDKVSMTVAQMPETSGDDRGTGLGDNHELKTTRAQRARRRAARGAQDE